MRRRFSTYHLTSAAHNARIAGEAEDALESEGLDGEFRNESLRRWQPIHDAHIVAAFIEAFAAVESGVNEEFSISRGSGGGEVTRFMEDYPGDLIREKSTLAKAQLVLRLTGVEEFDTGEQPYQDINLLRLVRNHFVHHEHEIPSDRILGGLATKNLDENPYAGDGGDGLAQYISYDCAKWAFDSTMDFLDEFHDRIDARRPYSAYQERLRAEIEVGWIDEGPQW